LLNLRYLASCGGATQQRRYLAMKVRTTMTKLFKEIYFRELDIKAQLDSRLTVYVAVLTAIGGIVAFLVRSAWPVSTKFHYVSLAVSTISIILLTIAIICAFRANLGYLYQRLPSSDDILKYSKSLIDYYQVNKGMAGNASTDFNEYLLERLSSASTRNSENNLKRSAYYYRTSQFILWTIVSSGVSGIALVINEVFALLLKKGP
jgi:hypothetical protein